MRELVFRLIFALFIGLSGLHGLPRAQQAMATCAATVSGASPTNYMPCMTTFAVTLAGWLFAGMTATFVVVWLLKRLLPRDRW